jgi:putative acetyltransferase
MQFDSHSAGVVIEEVVTASPLAAVAELFCEYREALLAHDVPIDSFQGFGAEIASLPFKYTRAQRGALFLARDSATGATAGCAALKDLGGGVGEVKRLFTRPAYRRRGVAAALSRAVEAAARELGYERLVLDTLVRLPGARELYASLGFVDVERYNDNPMPDAEFLGKALALTRGLPLVK